MPEPQIDILIEQLTRANRRWKRLALGTLAALLLGVAGFATFLVVKAVRARDAAVAERIEAKKARR